MEKLIQYEVLALFGIVIFALAIPYIWEGILAIKDFIGDFIGDLNEDDRPYGI